MAGAEGGRFDFDDGGSYVGEWHDGRAHGLGIATGPDNQGEYSGEWIMGFESRGVYVWPSGNLYAGNWLKGKRHGDGIQVKGRWIYRGGFTAGFCGRYGVKESLTTSAKYEGSWHLNQFDGFGVETNSDSSYYAGGWSKGLRQGYGVRKSAPYGLASENNRAVRAAQSQSSLPSAQDSDRGWRGGTSPGSGDQQDRGRSETIRSGFVLRSSSQPVSGTTSRSMREFRSPSPADKKESFRKFIIRKLRKPRSTGDLTSIGAHTIGGVPSSIGSAGRYQMHPLNPGGSLRSNLSGIVQHRYFNTDTLDSRTGLAPGFDALDEPLGPNVTETYSGQWNEDRRSGYGVAERSDGLRYEGEWFNNKKDGFGASYHPDGSKDEGRYKENILIHALSKRSKLYLLRHSKLRDSVEEAVRKAKDAAKEAQEKSAEVAQQRAQTARSIAATAEKKAEDARKLSEAAREIAREFASDFIQMGVRWEKENPYSRMLFGGGLGSTADQFDNSAVDSSAGNNQQVTTSNLNVTSLEVSGGTRRGSFRSSFKRNNSPNAPATSEPVAEKNQNLLSPTSPLSVHVNQQQSHNYAVENVAADTQPKFETIDTVSGIHVDAVKLQTATLHSANTTPVAKRELYKTALLTGPPAMHAQLTLIQPPERVTQGRPMTRAATSGFTGPSVANRESFSKEEAHEGVTKAVRTRRRTLPSIIDVPPPQPLKSREPVATATKWGRNWNLGLNSPAIANRSGEKMFTVPGLGAQIETACSNENLRIDVSQDTYIIEDGIRKRIHPTRLSPSQVTSRTRQTTSPAKTQIDRMHTRDFTVDGKTGLHQLQDDYDTGELLPFPDAYTTESIVDISGGLDVSMPDITKAMATAPGGQVAKRLGISGLLTREEVSRLGQQRRHELLLEMERKKRGEIIIRLADIKDWIRSNILVVMLVLFNAFLIFLFINLLNNAGSSGPSISEPATVLTQEEKLAAAATAEEAIKKALRSANAANYKPRNVK